MHIVIKISESIYDCAKELGSLSVRQVIEVENAIKNGTPLPKGHKRLIEDNFEVGPVFDKEGNRIGYRYVTQEDLDNALTILEADAESEDKE